MYGFIPGNGDGIDHPPRLSSRGHCTKPCPLLLTQDQVDHPASANVRPRVAAVVEDFGAVRSRRLARASARIGIAEKSRESYICVASATAVEVR